MGLKSLCMCLLARKSIALALLTTAVGICVSARPQTLPQSASSHEQWWQQVPTYLEQSEPTAINPFWAKRLTGYITTRDGLNLRYSVLLPQGEGPFPVIINYSGYDPGAIGGLAYLHNNTAMSRNLDRTLLEHGYAVIGVNARGTGCSEGTFDFLARSYGTDGADAVEWAAKQPWSSGAIGMANWSWAGMSQVATASERPPHLKAIAPGMVLTDPRLDSWELGGVSSVGFVTGWWDFLHSRWAAVRKSAEAEHDSRCLSQIDENYANGEKETLPTLLLRHPLRDAWVDARTILNRAQQINVPVLSMESFQDEATTARGGYYQERLDPQRLWLIQTNGNHDLYESLRYREVLIGFLDRFVKGVTNGFEKKPHVEVWEETSSSGKEPGHDRDEQAAPAWVVHRESFPVKVDMLHFSLGAEGTLSQGRAGSGKPDVYRYPIPGPTVDAEYGTSAWGELNPEWRKSSLVYTTSPLDRDLLTYGPASADLWVSSTSSDTDLQVTLTEVLPDGQEVFVQRGWLRLSHRALDETRSTAVRPMLLDKPESMVALTPGIPVLGRVELTKFSYAFRAGSRLRIWIDAPSATGGNSFNYVSAPSTNTIWHDAAHPSRLVIGVLSDATVPKARPECGTVLMQPCRKDPLGR
jgi:putative CocE/NonD family hydrolase